MFGEPSLFSQNNHNVIMDVQRPLKRRYLNIDTKFREMYDYRQPANYTFSLSDRLTNVSSLELITASIPITYYNVFSDPNCIDKGNNYIKITDLSTSTITVLKLTNNYYTHSTLKTEINAKLTASSITNLTYDISNNKSLFTSTGTHSMYITVNVDANGNTNNSNLLNNLGWRLGFRNDSYTVTSSSSVLSECNIDIKYPRYLYVIVDDFSRVSENNFHSITPGYSMDKNIIAKIAIPNMSYGDTLVATRENGYLISDIRRYNGITHIGKVQIRIIDENGQTVNFNGSDFVCTFQLD
jgi:hypothetical protein